MANDTSLNGVGIFGQGIRQGDPGYVSEIMAELEELGFGAIFMPGTAGGSDVFPTIDRILASTKAIPVATSVINIWMHPPSECAQWWNKFEATYPGRFHLGIGISHGEFVDRPREVLTDLGIKAPDTLFKDEPGRWNRSGPLATLSAYLDELDSATPPVPAGRRIIGALGPKMLDLARERSAGTHPAVMPLEHTRFAREHIGPGGLVAAYQAVLFEADPDTARKRARQYTRTFLSFVNYRKNIARFGFEESEMVDGGSDRLVDAIVAWGDDDTIAQRLSDQFAAGADHVSVGVVDQYVDVPLPVEDWRRLAAIIA